MKRTSAIAALTRRFGKQNGVAIILSLGILSLVLILAMSYAYNSETNHQIASVNNDRVVARIMAAAAVSRGISLLREVNDQVVTRKKFYVPPTGAMKNRAYLVSQNPDGILDGTDSAAQALTINYNGRDFTTEAGFLTETGYTSDVGWIYQTTLSDNTTTGAATDSDVKVVSRIAYAIFDESGKVDPGQFVDTTGLGPAEGSENGAGVSMAELNLKYVLACQRNNIISPATAETLAENFQQSNHANGQLGRGQVWHSHYDIFNTINGVISDQTLADTVATLLMPYSTTDSGGKYWADINDDSIIDHDTEIRDKIDVHNVGAFFGPSITPTELYDEFVGYDAGTNPGRDNSAYFSQWLKSLVIPGADAAAIRARKRVIAAQAAINMIDYADKLDIPTHVYLADTTDSFALTTTDGGNTEYELYGTEGTYVVGKMMAYLIFTRGTGTEVRELTIAPAVRIDLLHPFTESTSAPNFSGTVDVEYELSVTFPTGTHLETDSPNNGTLTSSGTINHVNVTSGGRLATLWAALNAKTVYSSAFVDGNPGNIQINYYRIKKVTVTDATGTLDVLPDKVGATIYQFDLGTTPLSLFDNQTRVSYMALEYKDPRLNGFHEQHDEFDDFLEVAKNSGSNYFLSEAICDIDAGITPFGSALDNGFDVTWKVRSRATSGENDQDYGDSYIMNNGGFMHKVEIGRVSSPHTPCRSMRLWTYDAADLDGRVDSYILDMFSDFRDDLIRGRININTNHGSVLRAALLNTRVTNPSGVDSVIVDILYANGSRGDGTVKPFMGIGALGYIPNIQADTDIRRYEDYDAEQRLATGSEYGTLGRLYPLVTVEKEYFTVIACAQTLRDIGKWDLGAAPETSGTPIAWKQSGSQYHYAIKQAEQKIVAVVSRDIFSNSYQVLGYEYLDD